MISRTLERLTVICVGVGLVVFVLSPIVLIPAVQATMPVELLTPLVSSILLATLALQAMYLLIQLTPDGRRAIPVAMLGGDAWFSILIGTMMPAVCWNYLVPLADPSLSPLRAVMLIPLVNALVFSTVRLYQLRRREVA